MRERGGGSWCGDEAGEVMGGRGGRSYVHSVGLAARRQQSIPCVEVDAAKSQGEERCAGCGRGEVRGIGIYGLCCAVLVACGCGCGCGCESDNASTAVSKYTACT